MSKSVEHEKVTRSQCLLEGYVKDNFLINARLDTHSHYCCRIMHYRAYPGSEFVVANTLAKWKKVEQNEINFS